MSKIFYYDYFTLRDVNIDKWNEDFFWLVARDTTTQITLDFKKEQQRIINELGHTFEGNCLFIGHHISTKYIQVINHYLLVNRLKEIDYEIVYSDKMKIIPLLLSNGSITFEHENIWAWADRYKNRYFKDLIKTATYNFKRGRYNLWDHLRLNKSVYAMGTEYVILRPYTQNLPKWVRLTSPKEWLDSNCSSKLPEIIRKKFKEITDLYMNFAQKYTVEKFGIELPNNIKNALWNFTFDYLEHIGDIHNDIRKKVHKKPIKYLLASTGAERYTRSLTLAVQEEGGKVTGFPHAYYIGHSSSPRQCYHDMAVFDEYIGYTPGSVPLIKSNLEINPPPRNKSIKIIHENTPYYRNIWKKYSSDSLPNKIKTVMVLELSLKSWEWAWYDGIDPLVHYHFCLNLCKCLSANGYNVIFKRRPKDVGWDGINIFKDIPNLKIVYDHFEAPGVIEMADAIITHYGYSSTLFWAMCTNKTVIYVKGIWEPWFKDVYNLLAKRCRILHCFFDDRNRQCFEEKELLNILSAPPEEPNTRFIEKYLFPENGISQ